MHTISANRGGYVLIDDQPLQVGDLAVKFYNGDSVQIADKLNTRAALVDSAYSEITNVETGTPFVSYIELKNFIQSNFFVEALNSEGVASKAYTDEKISEVQAEIDGIVGGYQDSLHIADTPTVDGYYLAAESGTYPNAGGQVITLDNGISFITKNGAVFGKIVIPITEVALANYALKSQTIVATATGVCLSAFIDNGNYTVEAVLLDGSRWPILIIGSDNLSDSIKKSIPGQNASSSPLGIEDTHGYVPWSILTDGSTWPAVQSTSTNTPVVAETAWVNLFPNIWEKLPRSAKKLTNGTPELPFILVFDGNSVIARTEHTTAGVVEPASYPPGLITNNFAAYTFRNIRTTDRPVYTRYDKAAVFTETGSFTTIIDDAAWDDEGDRPTETRVSTTSAAAIAFTIEAEYNYFNLVDRTDTLGCATNTISVVGGNGIVQVMLPGTAVWVEANGKTYSQLEVDNGTGYGNTIYARRIPMRKVSFGSTVTVNITKAADSSRFMYWGVEKVRGYNGYFQLINTARGHHTLAQLLLYVEDDIFGRKPDLLIFEIPLINMYGTDKTKAYSVDAVHDFVWGDRTGNINPNSLKNRSSDWANFEVLLLIPHISQSNFNADGTPVIDPTENTTAIDIWQAVKSLIIEKGDVPFIDIYSAVRRGADANFNGNYFDSMSASGITGGSYANDGTHLNDKGTALAAKVFCPIFDINTY